MQKRFAFHEPRTTSKVTVCCVGCDAEAEDTRLVLMTIGWSELVRIYDSWCWFEYLARCPNCTEIKR